MNRYGVTVRIPGVTGANAFFAFLAGAFARRDARAIDTPRRANRGGGLSLRVGGHRNHHGDRTTFRIRRDAPSGATGLKPSLSNIPTVPNQRDWEPPFFDTTGYASTMPPPCLLIDASAPLRALVATPCPRWSLSTTMQMIRQSLRSSLRSSLR